MGGSRLARLLPSLPRREARLDRAGYRPAAPAARRALEGATGSFVEGFNLARRIADDGRLAARLEASFDDHHRGFAYEGAGGQRALLDLLLPWGGGRLERFTHGAAARHDYIAAVGAGLVLARLPGGVARIDGYMQRLDPLLAWCVPDGYGFASGLARPRRWLGERQPPPDGLARFARRLFDNGLGRSVWWVEGAAPAAVQAAVEGFPADRRPHLWFGVGLACAYAGGVDADGLRELPGRAAEDAAELLAGVHFACRLRQKGGNPSPATELAASTLLGSAADDAASLLGTLLAETLEETSVSETELRSRTFEALRRRLTHLIQSNDTPASSARAGSAARAV